MGKVLKHKTNKYTTLPGKCKLFREKNTERSAETTKGELFLNLPARSDSKIKRQIAYIFNSLSLDENVEHIFCVISMGFFNGFYQLVQGEMIHAINIPGSQSKRS